MKRPLLLCTLTFILLNVWRCETDPFIFSPASKIELSKTPCFGECPVYSVSINGKGVLTYNGQNFVKVSGEHTVNLPPEATNELFKSFFDVNFWAFEDEYTDNISDLSTTWVSLTHEGRTKKIKDYYGAPEALKELEQKVDALVKTHVWEVTD